MALNFLKSESDYQIHFHYHGTMQRNLWFQQKVTDDQQEVQNAKRNTDDEKYVNIQICRSYFLDP